MNATLRQLRIFTALAESLNFSRTAEQVFVTQPSLSKLVKDLEDALGVVLFRRSTRQVMLTPEGARLLPLARQMISGFDDGMALLMRQATREACKVAIASLPSLACVLLPPVAQALQCEFPDVEFTVHDGSAEATIERLMARQVDFGLAAADSSKPDLVYEEILQDRFVLLAGGKLRQRIKASMTLEEILDLPLISMTDASTAKKYMAAAYLQLNVEFRPVMQFDQMSTIGGFVRQGLGVAVMPYLGILPLLNAGDLTVADISDGPVRSVGIITRRHEPLSGITSQALAHVRRSAQRIIASEPSRVKPPQPQPLPLP